MNFKEAPISIKDSMSIKRDKLIKAQNETLKAERDILENTDSKLNQEVFELENRIKSLNKRRELN